VKAGMERQAPAARRNHQGRDRRELLPVAGTAQNRRLAPRRPGPTDVRDEEEPAFVEEDEMGPKSFGFFLYAATDTVSNARCLPRSSRGPWTWASGKTSPGPEGASRYGRGDSSLQGAAGSPPRSGPGSTDPWSILRPTHCERVSASACASALHSTAGDGRKPGWASIRSRRSSDTLATIERRCLLRSSTSGRHPIRNGLPSSALRPSVFVFPTLGLFQGVSCPIG
jgi:hypothetical protein